MALLTFAIMAYPALQALYELSEAKAAFCAKRETSAKRETRGGKKLMERRKIKGSLPSLIVPITPHAPLGRPCFINTRGYKL